MLPLLLKDGHLVTYISTMVLYCILYYNFYPTLTSTKEMVSDKPQWSKIISNLLVGFHISSVIRVIFLPKQSQDSRSVLKDTSRSLGLCRKGKSPIIAKFHRTDLVLCTCSHSRERKTLFYSRINMVFYYIYVLDFPVLCSFPI